MIGIKPIPIHCTCSFAVFFCLILMAQMVFGHGLMCEPRQRGAYVNDKCGSNLPEPRNPVIDYCAHCLNGGSVGSVRQNLPPEGWLLYEPLVDFKKTATRAGLCGDAKENNDHMIGGTYVPSSYGGAPIVSHWKTGATVDFTAEIDTNHNGYFEFFLCNLDKCGTKDIAEKCFTNKYCHKLMRVKHEDCENPSPKTHTECGPIDENYPGRWYLPCRKTEHVGVHIVGGDSGTMRYKLPDGESCDHCVVQWYWAAANTCAPRGFLDYMIHKNKPFGTTCPSDGGGSGGFRDGMSECGGANLPEEFWSCADVKISRKGGSAGGVAGEESGNSDTRTDDKSGESESDTNFDGEETSNNESSGSGFGDGENNNEGNDSGHSNDDSHGNTTGDKIENPAEDDDNSGPSCRLEGHACDGKSRCCESTNLVCVLRSGEESPRCTVWWKLGDVTNMLENRI